VRLEKDGRKAELVVSPLMRLTTLPTWREVRFEVSTDKDAVVVVDRMAGFEASGGGITLLEGLQSA
jgi:hypothetical protein